MKNVRWVGVATEQYAAMSDFVENVMGLQKSFEEPTTVEFTTEDGDALQLMAPGDRYFALFTEHARGPVPLFEVADVHEASRELVAAGIQLVGDPGRDSQWEWVNFRAPDGNLYELASRLPG